MCHVSYVVANCNCADDDEMCATVKDDFQLTDRIGHAQKSSLISPSVNNYAILKILHNTPVGLTSYQKMNCAVLRKHIF